MDTSSLLVMHSTDILAMSQSDYISFYTSLQKEILHHNNLYYNKSDPIITDTQRDHLFALLKYAEFVHPDLISPDSPTQKIAGQLDIQDQFAKAKHRVHIGSLTNSYDAQDIYDRHTSISKLLSQSEIYDSTYILQPKFDGISVELIYTDGTLAQAITRGDGYIGEDITSNAKVIIGVPHHIDMQYILTELGLDDSIHQISFRGEIVMPKSIFDDLNIQRLASGQNAFVNPRNAASGSIKLLDPNIVKTRGLRCYVFDILWYR